MWIDVSSHLCSMPRIFACNRTGKDRHGIVWFESDGEENISKWIYLRGPSEGLCLDMTFCLELSLPRAIRSRVPNLLRIYSDRVGASGLTSSVGSFDPEYSFNGQVIPANCMTREL